MKDIAYLDKTALIKELTSIQSNLTKGKVLTNILELSFLIEKLKEKRQFTGGENG